MNRLASIACEQVDRLDPTLTTDGLSEFLPPADASHVDPRLAVNTLQELFADERPALSVTNNLDETPIPIGDRELDSGGLGEYFRGLEDAPAVTDGDRVAKDDVDVDVDAEIVDVAAENPGFQSEIQRAAMDFQRFAEKFHAFASQCQQQRAVVPARTGS